MFLDMQWGMSAVGWSFDLLGFSAMCCTYTLHNQTHTYLAPHICNHELYTMRVNLGQNMCARLQRGS